MSDQLFPGSRESFAQPVAVKKSDNGMSLISLYLTFLHLFSAIELKIGKETVKFLAIFDHVSACAISPPFSPFLPVKSSRFDPPPEELRRLDVRPNIDFSLTLRHFPSMAKPALGRGLGALLGGSPVAKPPGPAPATATTIPAAAPAIDTRERVQRVPLTRIRACPFQPRKEFSPETLRELADSIKEQGIVQPLIVRELNGHLELIAGERRWRAAQLLGLADVPVIVREADDRAVLELALIENLQRENLNPMEEAQGYAQLIQQFQLKQDEVAAKVGKSRAAVANSLRLLKLALPIQDFIRHGQLSFGHAKVILGLSDERQQKLAADRILKDGLNVRQAEALVAKLEAREPQTGARPGPTPLTKDTHVTDLENRLRERLGTKVHLRYAQGKGALEIAFFSDDELERVLEILGIKLD